MPKIEVSVGELVDKVTILEIKLERIKDQTKLNYIKDEWVILEKSMKQEDIPMDLYKQLLEVNKELWDAEDVIRDMEKKKDFGDEFIQCARLDAILNDRRFTIKNKINNFSNSEVKEQKSYEGLYTPN
jgi:hypothetical protein